MCVLIPLCMSAYYYIYYILPPSVNMFWKGQKYQYCPHTTIYMCVLILLYMCPHTTIYVSSYFYISVLIFLCVLILLHMCPHTATYVSSYYYVAESALRHALCIAAASSTRFLLHSSCMQHMHLRRKVAEWNRAFSCTVVSWYCFLSRHSSCMQHMHLRRKARCSTRALKGSLKALL